MLNITPVFYEYNHYEVNFYLNLYNLSIYLNLFLYKKGYINFIAGEKKLNNKLNHSLPFISYNLSKCLNISLVQPFYLTKKSNLI